MKPIRAVALVFAATTSSAAAFSPQHRNTVVRLCCERGTESVPVPVQATTQNIDLEDASLVDLTYITDLKVGDRVVVTSKSQSDWKGKILRIKVLKSKRIEAFLEGTNPKYSSRHFPPQSLTNANGRPDLDLPKLIEEQFQWVESQMRQRDRVPSVMYDSAKNQNVAVAAASSTVAPLRDDGFHVLLACDVEDIPSLDKLQDTTALSERLEECYLEWPKSPTKATHEAHAEQGKLFGAVLTKQGHEQAFVAKYTEPQKPSATSIPFIVAGVLDGHGEAGRGISERRRQEILHRLPATLEEVDVATFNAGSKGNDVLEKKISRALSDLVDSVDQELPLPVASKGMATSFVVQRQDQMYFVNNGDACSFLAAAIIDADTGLVRDVQVVFQTTPHKLAGIERQRLEKAGVHVGSGDRVWCHFLRKRSIVTRSRWYPVNTTRSLDSQDNTDLPTVTAHASDETIHNVVTEYNKANPNGCIANQSVHLFVGSATKELMNEVQIESLACRLVKGIYDENMHALIAIKSVFEAAERTEDGMSIALVRIS